MRIPDANKACSFNRHEACCFLEQGGVMLCIDGNSQIFGTLHVSQQFQILGAKHWCTWKAEIVWYFVWHTRTTAGCFSPGDDWVGDRPFIWRFSRHDACTALKTYADAWEKGWHAVMARLHPTAFKHSGMHTASCFSQLACCYLQLRVNACLICVR
jgi:hypothetical protein